MRRRELLAAGVAALAGCGSAGEGSPSRTPSPEPTPVPTGTVGIETRVENRDDVERTVAVAATHRARPDCSFAATPCGRPDRSEPLVDAELAVGAGRAVDFPAASFGVSADAVDVLAVEVAVGDTSRTVRGIEEGARSTMGDAYEERPYRFQFRPGDYLLRVPVLTGQPQIRIARR